MSVDVEGELIETGVDAVRRALLEAKHCLDALLSDQTAMASIYRASELMVTALKAKGKIVSCGNGGSLCDAMHFAEELSGRFRADRPALAAISISEPGFLTCAGNDFGYEKIFLRYCQALLNPQDVLLAISTSGKSPNVLEAAAWAKQNGATVIGLTGRADTPLSKFCDVCVVTRGSSAGWADRVQEQHIKVIHIWIELIEQAMFGD